MARALSAWVAAVAPDTRAVIGLSESGGALATAVARDCDAPAIVCAAAPGEDDGVGELAGKDWAGDWEMFRAIGSRPPHSTWRPDLLWWLVEHGTRVRADGRTELTSRPEPIAGLNGGFDYEPDARIEESPLVDPPMAAKRIRELLDSLG